MKEFPLGPHGETCEFCTIDAAHHLGLVFPLSSDFGGIACHRARALLLFLP
jgi:hypothetical protein